MDRVRLEGLLLAEITYPEGSPVPGLVNALFELYSDLAATAPRLMYLYARRHALDMTIGGAWQDVSWEETGIAESDGQGVDHLLRMRADAHADIQRIEAQARANRAPAVGVITAATPAGPPAAGVADPNAAAYRGDPLMRSR
jgi:hypothetical protein